MRFHNTQIVYILQPTSFVDTSQACYIYNITSNQGRIFCCYPPRQGWRIFPRFLRIPFPKVVFFLICDRGRFQKGMGRFFKILSEYPCKYLCQVWRSSTTKQYFDFCQSLSNISAYRWNKKRKSTISILCELLLDLVFVAYYVTGVVFNEVGLHC